MPWRIAAHMGCVIRRDDSCESSIAIGSNGGLHIDVTFINKHLIEHWHLANHVAKKQIDDSIFDIRSQQAQDEILKTLNVDKIWGIAGRWSERLRLMGISKASELRDASPTIIRKHLSVVG